MIQNSSMNELERRATEALQALLGQVSVIKLKEIRRTPKGPMMARVDVLGHSHMLACEIQSNFRPDNLRQALEALHTKTANCDSAATPVLIAPYLSPEAQAICKECSASYIDLEGNARLDVGEVFIGKRSQPARAARHATEAPAPAHLLRPFPPAHVGPTARGRSLTA